MVFCIDARFSDGSKQIEVLDKSTDQHTLIECDGTLYKFELHPSPGQPTFNINNIHCAHLNPVQYHSLVGKQIVIMLKDEDGAGKFLCNAFELNLDIISNEEMASRLNKRKQLDDLAKEAMEIQEKRPRITERILNYERITVSMQSVYEDAKDEDDRVTLQDCLAKFHDKYWDETRAHYLAKTDSDLSMQRVKRAEDKLTCELALLSSRCF
jgi:hypothetical protein